MNSRSNLLLIQTPEGIAFPLYLAGPVVRLLALVIDTACISAITSVVGLLLGSFRAINWDVASAISVIVFFLISFGYPILTEWFWKGQTVGKRLFRLRVMDVQGLKLQFSQVVIRNLFRLLDFFPVLYIVGGLSAFFSSRCQRLGDIAANTIVIRHPPSVEPDLTQALSGKFNSFRDYPHLAARLRQQISPEEAGILLQAVLRRDQLDPFARLDLFQRLATHLRTIVEFPPEASDGLTDEQYVRNATDILFQKSASAHTWLVLREHRL